MFLLACSDSTPKKGKGILPSNSHQTVYKNQTIEDDEGTKLAYSIGDSLPTARAQGSVIERHKELGKDPADAIALWIEAAIRAQLGQNEGWEALGELTLDGKQKMGTRFFSEKHVQFQPGPAFSYLS